MIKDFWSDSEANEYLRRYNTKGISSDLALRVYSSHLLGKERRLVLHGGGNTSVKTLGTDILGREVPVLSVKGSGWDLSSIEPEGLPAVRLEPLLELEALSELSDQAMVNYLRLNLLDASAPTPSVESLLHAFLPHKYVDHSHALDILAIVDQPDAEDLAEQVFGDRVGYVPYTMPGFSLAKAAAAIYRTNCRVEGLVLIKHGLFAFGSTAEQSYRSTVALANLAAEYVKKCRRTQVFFPRVPPGKIAPRLSEIAPVLRGILAQEARDGDVVRWILDFRSSPLISQFVDGENLVDYANRGPVTPDHLIRTKGRPLILPVPANDGLEAFRVEAARSVSKYTGAYSEYFNRHNSRCAPSKTPLDPIPRVLLVPGVGLFGVGKTAKEAAIVADIAETWVETVTAAESIGEFCSLDESDQFDVEYWSLEQAKIGKNVERPLERQVVLITGAAGAIGIATAKAFADYGAEVVLADLDGAKAAALARAISGTALGLECDVTNSRSVRETFDRACTRFGGIDVVVSNAGAAWTGPIATVSDDILRKSFELNFFAHQTVAQNAVRVLRLQRTGGAILFNVSKQAVNPGRDFGAYGIPKAAALALARQYALEHGSDKIRVNAVNPDRIRSGLLTDEMIASRARSRGVTEQDYMAGNLLGCEVTAEDVAQAFVHHALARKTTGDITTIDGGNVAAFLR
jgi:rhamnose utilization protein RhaD (predicted bifunctional aldolase and dehydrogenase)/NAD(P)-dependent dehydrogenase (short-subunit alcohol dehydrogenase family)